MTTSKSSEKKSILDSASKVSVDKRLSKQRIIGFLLLF